ncbi:MAG: hypothetical protein JWQ74_1489 [Marmoricola sp.]|nr:hypothetical protein [Marmoricola sp.]
MSLLSGLVAGLAAAALAGHPVFSFSDPTIDESSGLVDLGSLMVTTNDSGGDPLVFVIDPRTGATVGRTTFTSEVTDVEALAPTGAGSGDKSVWVGDIGDNKAVRTSVQVYEVPVGRGDRAVRATAYDLVYPDGPRDAESLVVGRDGRLRIISKGLFGGRVYVAPKKLNPDRPNRLVPGPQVSIFATDAALFPDGKHVLVRGYGNALISTFPGFRTVARVELPVQEQGEGVSISPSGQIRLSSEGARSAVLQITLPRDVRAKLAPAAVVAGPRTPGTGDTGVLDSSASGLSWPWVLGGGAAVLGAVVLGARALALQRRRR